LRVGRARSRDAAFTLIELMVALAVIALIMGVAVRGMRSMLKSDLRATSIKMAGAIRYLFDRASTTGKIHRLVIDFEQGRYWAEVSDDRFYMPRERETDETREQVAEEEAAEAEEKKKEEEAQLQSEGQVDMSKYIPQEFKPQRARFSAFKEMAVKPVQVKGGIKITGLFTPRLAQPQTTGRGYIYFFPLGLTEAAQVYLSDDDGQQSFYSLVVHPLTGRVRVHNTFVQPPVEEQYDDEGNKLEHE
jgi:prepilin-type N-terminal cleavage/methylation domain-containing protein